MFLWIALTLAAVSSVCAFDSSRADNLVVSWDPGSHEDVDVQKPLWYYCQDNSIDVIPIAYLNVSFDDFGPSFITPPADLCATHCNTFLRTDIASCQSLASDIRACQAKGKLVTLNIGSSASGAGFSSASQAARFAQTIWELFLGGSSSDRPFGDVVLDGINVALVSDSADHVSTLVEKIRAFSGSHKQYHISAAPQCQSAEAYVGTALSDTAFDAVYIPFHHRDQSSVQAAYAAWDTWANTASINPDVKLYTVAPTTASAVAEASYADALAFVTTALQIRDQYDSFGGMTLSSAYNAYKIKDAIRVADVGLPLEIDVPAEWQEKLGRRSGTSDAARKIGVWSEDVEYSAETRIVYHGSLWAAQRTTVAEAPGSAGGATAWVFKGSCAGKQKPPPAQAALVSPVSPVPVVVKSF